MKMSEWISVKDRLHLTDAESVIYRRHGRNITEMNPVDEFICSECERCFLDSLNAYDKENEGCYEYEPNYCPHCGVKIDKE